jgi:hypothetical protein
MSVFEKNNTSIIENNFSNNEIRIVFVDGLKLTDLKIFFKQNLPTIFLSYNKDYILKNNHSLLEFHVALLTPIDLLSFKEILKILTIKYNTNFLLLTFIIQDKCQKSIFVILLDV